MSRFQLFTACAVLLAASPALMGAQISGEYLESRTCDVWTGPCFANAEMDLAGKEAVMAWKVDEGSWNDVSLDGLGVALVVNSKWTLGYDGTFPMNTEDIKSVILVDSDADEKQREALISFVKDTAKELIGSVRRIESVDFELKNDHLDGKGVFKAGKLAKIETRALKKNDCICGNELLYYQPLTKVENASAAFSTTLSYQGKGLNHKWNAKHKRGAYLATFRR